MRFPVQEITNIFDTVHFMVADVNWDMNYFDVHVLNEYNRIVGTSSTSGVKSATHQPCRPINITPSFVPGGKRSSAWLRGASFHKNFDWVPFFGCIGRRWKDLCLAEVIDVVNEITKTRSHMVDGCLMF